MYYSLYITYNIVKIKDVGKLTQGSKIANFYDNGKKQADTAPIATENQRFVHLCCFYKLVLAEFKISRQNFLYPQELCATAFSHTDHQYRVGNPLKNKIMEEPSARLNIPAANQHAPVTLAHQLQPQMARQIVVREVCRKQHSVCVTKSAITVIHYKIDVELSKESSLKQSPIDDFLRIYIDIHSPS